MYLQEVISTKKLTKRVSSGAGSESEFVIQCTDPRIRILLKISRIQNIDFFILNFFVCLF